MLESYGQEPTSTIVSISIEQVNKYKGPDYRELGDDDQTGELQKRLHQKFVKTLGQTPRNIFSSSPTAASASATGTHGSDEDEQNRELKTLLHQDGGWTIPPLDIHDNSQRRQS
ncbi:hypothetical protein LTS10_011610 [Elasticomyces elasticus]|nr:hypothetical protein LTS10_011610 [Elasticomyces elasticus]